MTRIMSKIFVISFAVIVVIGIFTILFFWADRNERDAAQRDKECWKKIYEIIEASPKDKADWIKQTISDRVSFRGGVDYCRALEFIRNGTELSSTGVCYSSETENTSAMSKTRDIRWSISYADSVNALHQRSCLGDCW